MWCTKVAWTENTSLKKIEFNRKKLLEYILLLVLQGSVLKGEVHEHLFKYSNTEILNRLKYTSKDSDFIALLLNKLEEENNKSYDNSIALQIRNN